MTNCEKSKSDIIFLPVDSLSILAQDKSFCPFEDKKVCPVT